MLRVLAAGVDSLYASLPRMQEGLGYDIDHLAEALTQRARAQEAREPVRWDCGDLGCSFLVQPRGWRHYAVWLHIPDVLDIRLGVDAEDHRPVLQVEWRSPYLHAVGIEAAVAQGEAIAAYFAPHAAMAGNPPGSELTASRVDVYADTQGWEPTLADGDRFVTRARHRDRFEDPVTEALRTHQQGRHLSGWTLGRGDILCRVYDKTRDMRRRGCTWVPETWTGYDATRPVWRVEFQYRRAALADFRNGGARVQSVADVLAARQALWDYSTQWLSLRVPNADTNPSRWPVDPTWEEVRAAAVGSPASELVRQRLREANRLRLIQGFLGYTSSLAALSRVDRLDDALRAVKPDADRYLRQRGASFAAITEHKRRVRIAV